VIEAAVEPRQRFGDVIGAALFGAFVAFVTPLFARSRTGALRKRRLRDAFDVTREIVETIIDGRELFAARIVVVIVSV
jgi:hypothetical protein